MKGSEDSEIMRAFLQKMVEVKLLVTDDEFYEMKVELSKLDEGECPMLKAFLKELTE